MSKYRGLFKNRYGDQLKGHDWPRLLDPDDLRVLVDIGLRAADHGKLGGRALVDKHGKAHMQKIGRIGGLVSGIKRQFKKAVLEATLEDFNVQFRS